LINRNQGYLTKPQPAQVVGDIPCFSPIWNYGEKWEKNIV